MTKPAKLNVNPTEPNIVDLPLEILIDEIAVKLSDRDKINFFSVSKSLKKDAAEERLKAQCERIAMEHKHASYPKAITLLYKLQQQKNSDHAKLITAKLLGDKTWERANPLLAYEMAKEVWEKNPTTKVAEVLKDISSYLSELYNDKDNKLGVPHDPQESIKLDKQVIALEAVVGEKIKLIEKMYRKMYRKYSSDFPPAMALELLIDTITPLIDQGIFSVAAPHDGGAVPRDDIPLLDLVPGFVVLVDLDLSNAEEVNHQKFIDFYRKLLSHEADFPGLHFAEVWQAINEQLAALEKGQRNAVSRPRV